jgi:hypothetical protein
MTIAPPSMFYTYRSSRSPLVYSRLESTGYQRLESVVMNHAFPPTPAPSLPSPSTMNDPTMSHFDTNNIYPKHGSSSSSTFNPLTAPLPPTPPAEDPVDMQRLSIRDEVMPQRIRRGRTPVFDPDGFSPQRVLSEAHHISDNADQGQSSRQRLDVDLDAYANDFDDSREPTLSFHTSSTVESTTGTPSSMHGAYGFAHDGQGDKAPVEPRIRVRTTNGRSTAYSSAESSGAYSYHQYETNLFHPHPPPLPNRPHPFADPLGLGIRDGENPDIQAGHRPVTNTDFTYRPWEAEVVNRDRSTSSASLASFASRSSRGQSSSLQHYDYHYPEMLPWDTQRLMDNEPEAVVMVEEGRERTLDMAKLEEMGGIAQMTEQKIAKLSGNSAASSYVIVSLTCRGHTPAFAELRYRACRPASCHAANPCTYLGRTRYFAQFIYSTPSRAQAVFVSGRAQYLVQSHAAHLAIHWHPLQPSTAPDGSVYDTHPSFRDARLGESAYALSYVPDSCCGYH